MKYLKNARLGLVHFIAIAAIIVAPNLIEAQETQKTQEKNPILGPNYLYIEEYEITHGVIPNEAIDQLKGWVKIFRKTGEFKSVKLFIHNTGPRFALYIFLEPKNWQSLENGFSKFVEAVPDMMDTPHKFGAHSDNLLSELTVE